MIFTLILILAVAVFMAFFVGFNLSNTCNIWFFQNYTNIPVFVLVMIAFASGIVVSILFILIAKLKAPVKTEVIVKEKVKKEEKSPKVDKAEKIRLRLKKKQEKAEKKEKAQLNEKKDEPVLE